MPLTPIDIQQKTFGPELRGYNMDEVDDFLDEVVSTLKDYDQRVRDAQDRIRALEAEVASRGEDETAISRALVAAQKQADSVLAEARLEADRIREEAHGESDRLRSDRDAERLALTQEIARMRATVADLKRRIVDLATAVEDDLDTMDAAIAEAAAVVDGSFETPVGESDPSRYEIEPEAADEIGDWGETSEDFAEQSPVEWEEEAATDLTEDDGDWGAEVVEEEVVTEELVTEEVSETTDDRDGTDYDEAVEDEPADLSTDEGDDDESGAGGRDFGTLADRMAREAAGGEGGGEAASPGRRPWERGSV